VIGYSVVSSSVGASIMFIAQETQKGTAKEKTLKKLWRFSLEVLCAHE
jgi:hypothetical protein